MDYNKIDLEKERTQAELKNLLDAVKINFKDFLTKDEQDYYVKEINKLIITVDLDEILYEFDRTRSEMNDIKD